MPAIRRHRARGGSEVSPPDGDAAWVLPAWWGEDGAAKGWVPLGLPGIDTPRWLLDPAGGISPADARWSVEWWVGTDERWLVPSQEGTVRRRLIDGAPVVEARLHVPGGDLVLTEWAVPAGPKAGRVAVVVRNESPHALAFAAVLRPWGPGGRAGLTGVGIDHGLYAKAGTRPVRVESEERAAHCALPEKAGVDCGKAVLAHASRALTDAEALDPKGWANGALIWPLARQGSLHLQVTWGLGAAVPTSFDPAAAARGWRATAERAVRLDLPEGPFAAAVSAQIPRLLLAPAWPGLDAQGEALIVDALCSTGFAAEAAGAVARLWPEGRVGFRRPAGDIAAVLWAAGRAGPPASPELARTIGEGAEIVGRSLSRVGSPADTAWARAGLAAAARLLSDLGEERAAAEITAWVGSAPVGAPPPPLGPFSGTVVGALTAAASATRLGSDPTELLAAIVASGGTTWSWPGDPYDPLVAVAWWAVARSLLVDDSADRLALFPAFPRSWYGQAVEVHDLPTGAGRASWALRWHGERPALLWAVEGEGPLRVAAPGLDPSWSAAGRSGDALLRV